MSASLFRASLEACEAFVSSHCATGKSGVLCVAEEEVEECQGQILHQYRIMTPQRQKKKEVNKEEEASK